MIFQNKNALWSWVFAKALCEYTHKKIYFVISPGSRSAPLVKAFSMMEKIYKKRCRIFSVLDERTAGFFALGLAKKDYDKSLVVLLCTSGTATANYLPSIVEARMSKTPILVLTADRPEYDQSCHSGQTISQKGIYSSFVSICKNTTPASNPNKFKEIIALANEMVDILEKKEMPAHLNIQFDLPLYFNAKDSVSDFPFRFPKISFPKENLKNRATKKFIVSKKWEKILIVSGALLTNGRIDDVKKRFKSLLDSKRVVVLSDATSVLRSSNSSLINYSNLFRENKNLLLDKNFYPDVVFQVGELPENKDLRNALKAIDVPYFCFETKGEDMNALHKKNCISIDAPVEFVLEKCLLIENSYLKKWMSLSRGVDFYNTSLKNKRQLSELDIAQFVSQYSADENINLFIANGIILRDINRFYPAKKTTARIFYNRGANGIDGVIATAFGIASAAEKEPLLLYIGDMSFFYDIGAFLLKKDFCGSLTILLQNNSGGNIFRHLPFVEENETFEKLWITEQKCNVKKIAEAYAIKYFSPKKMMDLRNIFNKIKFFKGVQIIEIKTDGKEACRLRKSYFG